MRGPHASGLLISIDSVVLVVLSIVGVLDLLLIVLIILLLFVSHFLVLALLIVILFSVFVSSNFFVSQTIFLLLGCDLVIISGLFIGFQVVGISIIFLQNIMSRVNWGLFSVVSRCLCVHFVNGLA